MTENDSRGKHNNGKRHSTVFYMEALALVAAFTVVLLVLTKVFALSRQMSERARLLTCAVHLAENAAEAAAASDSPQALYELLDEGGNAWIFHANPLRDLYYSSPVVPSSAEEYSIVCVWYDSGMKPAPEGEFWVEIAWIPEMAEAPGTGDNTGLARCIIAVYWDDETLYTLETAVYRRQKP